MRLDSTKFHLDGGVNMAIYHFTTRIIKSSIGKCVVASAAYISGQKLKDARLGLSFNYKIGRGRVGKECRSRWSPYH